MTDFVVKNGLQIGGGSKLKSGTIAGNATLDLSSGNFFSHTPTADTTFVFSNPPAAGKAHGFALKVTGADTGSSYDLANASYDSVSFSLAGLGLYLSHVFFKPDGTKMYIAVDDNGEDVKEYDLSSAWDVSTASYVQRFILSSQITYPFGLFFKPDGTKMYVSDPSSQDINEYSLSSAWNISTASYTQNFSVSGNISFNTGLFFKPDGTKMYVVDYINNDVNEYSLSSAWDIATASYTQNFSISGQESQATGLFFDSSGSKMFITGQSGDDVNEYSLSSAWNISTASYIRNFSVASQASSPTGISFKPDGTKMYIVGSDTNTVYQYSTGSIDIATFTYPASVKFPNGTPPTAPAVGETDVLTFYTDDGGTTYSGFQAGDAMQ